ncbi:hypothetical protein ACFPT7_12930 [Acidicapsa dinghuensis]|uniref:Tetratricopeptide repeat protein n=1 Tax=Acidicapsa dinghuensis TaxID=2218256 RepID=A0ABW1EIU9_9BACT
MLGRLYIKCRDKTNAVSAFKQAKELSVDRTRRATITLNSNSLRVLYLNNNAARTPKLSRSINPPTANRIPAALTLAPFHHDHRVSRKQRSLLRFYVYAHRKSFSNLAFYSGQ